MKSFFKNYGVLLLIYLGAFMIFVTNMIYIAYSFWPFLR